MKLALSQRGEASSDAQRRQLNCDAQRRGPPGGLRINARALVAALFSALLGTIGSAAQAQPFETPPLPAPPRSLAIATPTEQRLPNGLRVVLAARPGVRLVTAQLLVLAGAEVDPPQRAGLASLAAGLLTKGTQGRSASAQAREAESLGGSLDSSAGWNQSQVSITVTVGQLNPALGLLADAVMRPTFAQAELERLRAQVLDGLKIAYSQPATLATLATERLLFGSRPYGHPADGTPASLPRITRTDLQALHRAHYRPDNAVLLLAGDLDDAGALRLAARHFGPWRGPQTGAATASRLALAALPTQAPAAGSSASPAAAAAAAPTPWLAIDMAKSDQATVMVAVPLPPLGADRATASVLNAVLGSDFSSRLNQEIRIQRGLSYGVGSQLDARRDGGALRVSVQTRNASAAEVVALVRTELDGLIDTPVPAAELAARKAALVGAFGRSIETTAGLGSALRSLVVAGVPVSELRARIEALSAVTADAVQRFAAAYLGAGARRVVVAGEALEFSASLQAQAPAQTPLSSPSRRFVTLTPATLDIERDGAWPDR